MYKQSLIPVNLAKKTKLIATSENDRMQQKKINLTCISYFYKFERLTNI